MTISEKLRLFWEQMTPNQKRVAVGLFLLTTVVFISGWFNAFSTWRQIRRVEREKIEAKRDADNALQRAAKIAEQLRTKELELKNLEAKRNEKQNELETANQQTRSAQRDYDRAVREPLGETPSADELCADLARIGYPCR